MIQALQSHNKGLYYGLRDAILSRLVTIIKCLVHHVLHFGVGRSQIEWKLKVKTDISVFPWPKIGQNYHSNPYIESTTVLSDNIYYYYITYIT